MSDNCETHSITNRKKRKLDILNDTKNASTHSSKKLKFNQHLQNIFNREKELKKEINKLKQERDKDKKERDYFYNQMNIYKQDTHKYKQTFSQMIAIIKPSQSQTHNQNTNGYENNNTNTNTNMINEPLQISNNHNNISNTQTIIQPSNNIQPRSFGMNQNNNFSDDETTEEESDSNASMTTNKQLSVPQLESLQNKNKIITTQTQTNYYCKKCNRYFKNGQALGGHNSTIHPVITTSSKYPGKFYCNKCKQFFNSDEKCQHFKSKRNKRNKNEGKHVCKYCSKRFDSGYALGGHMNAHRKSKSNGNSNNIKESEFKRDWNDCHFISVNCKFCQQHFDDFEEYCHHLENEFNNDGNKKWLYCNELNCDVTKRYSVQGFIAHLSMHGYGKPFHCNLNVSDRNKIKCNFSASTKANLIYTHLKKVHKISYA